MSHNIGDDVLDSRDLEERITELTDEKDMLQETGETLDEDDQDELDALTALRDETVSSGWYGGIFFVLDEYFTEYAQEFAEDIGAIDRNASWPLYYIDWDRAADDLKKDYLVAEIQGETYYYREA